MISLRDLVAAIEKDPEAGEAVGLFAIAMSNANDEIMVRVARESLIDRCNFLIIKNRKMLVRNAADVQMENEYEEHA